MAVKSRLFGPRRSTTAGPQSVGSVEAALAPALVDGRWRVPSRFNFTRDVVEALGQDEKRRALTFLGHDVVIEPRTFSQLALGAAQWATLLREVGVRPGDRVLVLAGASPDWVEAVLGVLKVGAVAVPSTERLTASALDIRIAASGAKVAVASSRAEVELARCTRTPTVLSVEAARRDAQRLPKEAPTHDTAARDSALIVSTAGRANGPRGVLHTHGATFAARAHAEHWLDAGLGDVVWCTAPVHSPQALWSTMFGPWARGASVVVQEGAFDPLERLDLLRRLGVTVLCQTPAEYRALADSGKLGRYRWARPRRLVSTGDELPEDVVQEFEEAWGLTIHDGYGQAEVGVVVGHWGDGAPRGSIGLPLPGYDVGVVDERGSVVPQGYEGELAVRGNPPSLFGGYWNAPDATNAAYRGDWFVTGDLAAQDEDGFLWLTERRAPAAQIVEPQAELEDDRDHEAPAVAAQMQAPVREARRPAAPPAAPSSVQPPVPAPVERTPAPAAPARPAPAAMQEPAPASGLAHADGEHERPRGRPPLFARFAVTIWILGAGVLIGGAAIPHAEDTPRVVPKSEDVPNAICLAPRP
jgi:acyl-coenzyme A synthetase/AMP-(fatty) acid ligase